MDPFILSTEESISVSIASFYGSEKTVRGNTTVRVYGSYYGKNPRRKDWQFITAREFFLVRLFVVQIFYEASLVSFCTNLLM